MSWPPASGPAAHGEAASAGRDQASGLIRREVTGRGGLDVTLEVANRDAGPSPENAVHRPFVITQATERFLHLPPVCFGHTGLSRYLCR
jgi:hypothetical protein